jgi:hypothetical protein
MPQFNIHTPKTPSDMKAARLSKITLPVGIIGNNHFFSYGFDGNTYYVTEGILQYFVTKMHLCFDEAKQLYNALTFIDASEPNTKIINQAIKQGRKKNLSEDKLFWHLVDNL